MTLATSCLIANLQIGVAAGADKAIIAAGAKIRYHFYVNTLEWKTSGDRLLPCKNFVPFMVGHVRLKSEFSALLTGVGADAADKFYVRLDIDPVPSYPESVGYAELPDVVYTRLVAIVGKGMRAREARAMEDLWSRLIGPLSHFAAKMASGEAFRDATVRNLAEAVELLPRLNFVGDKNLDSVVEQTKTLAIPFDAKALRKDTAYRAMRAQEAKRILDEIEQART